MVFVQDRVENIVEKGENVNSLRSFDPLLHNADFKQP